MRKRISFGALLDLLGCWAPAHHESLKARPPPCSNAIADIPSTSAALFSTVHPVIRHQSLVQSIAQPLDLILPRTQVIAWQFPE